MADSRLGERLTAIETIRQQIILNCVYLFIGVGALGAAAWAMITGQIESQGMDGLFLVLVCLLISGVFLLVPLQALRHGLLRDLLKRRDAKASSAAERQVTPVVAQEPQERI